MKSLLLWFRRYHRFTNTERGLGLRRSYFQSKRSKRSKEQVVTEREVFLEGLTHRSNRCLLPALPSLSTKQTHCCLNTTSCKDNVVTPRSTMISLYRQLKLVWEVNRHPTLSGMEVRHGLPLPSSAELSFDSRQIVPCAEVTALLGREAAHHLPLNRASKP